MKKTIALILACACFGSAATVHAEAPSNPRLMRALQTLSTRVRTNPTGYQIATGAAMVPIVALGAAGAASALAFAGRQAQPGGTAHRYMLRAMRETAGYTLFALPVGAVMVFGAMFGNVVMQEIYRNRAIGDQTLYQTKKGLDYFFQVPIDEQFLIARQSPEFAEYLVSLADALELLTDGFDNPNRPAVPRAM